MRFARVIVKGVIADKPTQYKKDNLLLQRSIDKGGDSILITADGNQGERTAYIVPTEYIKKILNKPLESEGNDE